MRDTFVRTLMELAENDSSIVLITGDLGFGVLRHFWEEYPHRFYNVGVAEQTMTGVATGLAMEGHTVFTYSIGNFPTLRCLEQIRNDAAYHQANVKIVSVGAGFAYGALGMSHHATEDVSIMRALPGVTIYTPADTEETAVCVRDMASREGTCYLRLGRGGDTAIHKNPIQNWKTGKALVLQSGTDVVFLTAGESIKQVLEASALLKESDVNAGVISFPCIKPLDVKVILETAFSIPLLVTIEEHTIIGGLGSAVSETLAETFGHGTRLVRLGVPDIYVSIVGSQAYLREQYGLNARAIVNRVLKELGK